jgi:pimeloyl-ACP methyl ester carboxylesterase
VPYFTTDDGCRIFYTPYGVDSSDPVVIFLNGTTQTTWYWGSHVAGFKKRYGLLCYDARGQGQSDLGAMPISLKLHVSDLKNLLGYLAVERAHLVGISHGARLALEFSLEFPSLVDHLVLCSLSARTSDRCRAIVRSWLEILQLSDLEAMAWAALPTVFGNKFFKHHQKIIDKIVSAVVVRNNKKALMAQLDAVLRYPPPDNIPADFNIPTLLISGSQDPLVEPDDVRRLAHLCRARHEELAEIGHSIPAEAPQLFEKLVLEFLAGGHILANKKCAVEK